MRSDRFGSPVHLARRFLTSLRSTAPPAADDDWAVSHLLPGEAVVWARLSGPDRRHAVAVGRSTVSLLGGSGPSGVDRAVVAAALLHDVGKVEAGVGTVRRAAVTALAVVVGPERLVRRIGGRTARYLEHSSIGARMLSEAGSDPLTVAWTLEHHLRPGSWTIPMAVGEALKAADDD